MNSFTISQISTYAGIKPHTIRMWEQRYGALKPGRSKGNTRYYNNAQLRRLLNIVSLRNTDYKVSELCAMSDDKLFELVEKYQTTTADEQNEYAVSQLIAAAMSYDENHFDKIFSHCVLRHGFNKTYRTVIHPLMEQIGLMWASNKIPPAQEHFISNLICQKLQAAIDSLPPAKNKSNPWLLFLPENEFHEVGLLFASYLIRLSGEKVIYLGANVPMESLTSAVKETRSSKLLLFWVHNDLPENTRKYIRQLVSAFPQTTLFLSGRPALMQQLEMPEKIKLLESIDDLERELV